jgi:hypothetical protein
MIRHLTRYLLVSASSLVVAAVMLPAGCVGFGNNECSGSIQACADEHAELVCSRGEDGVHRSFSQACQGGESCVNDDFGDGHCVPSPEGGSCTLPEACLDSPLCIGGRCSPLPPEVVSACSAALVLEVPTMEDGPEGVTVATSFEPGPAIVSDRFHLDPNPVEPSDKPCGAPAVGPERVIHVDLPITSTTDHPEGRRLVLTIEGLDSKAVSSVNSLVLQTCGEPRTYIWSECGQSPDGSALSHHIVNTDTPSTLSILLRAANALTKPAPFTLRAQLVPVDPG